MYHKAGDVLLQFSKEYAEAEKQGKQAEVVAKWKTFLAVMAAAMVAPTGRVKNVRMAAAAAAKKTPAEVTFSKGAAKSGGLAYHPVDGLVEVESLGQLVSITTLAVIGCWIGFAFYLYLRRDYFC